MEQTCQHCDYKTKSKILFEKHKARHRFCTYEGCNYHTMNGGHFKEHLKKHTGEKNFKCDVCQATFSQKSALTQHLKTHNNQRDHVCHICNATFTRNDHLQTHLGTHSDVKKYNCTIEGCNYKTSDSSSFSKHMRIHNNDKRYKCDFEGCNYETCIQSSLTVHKRIHTGEKPYKCTFEGCDYASKTLHGIKNHMNTHLDIDSRPYKCTLCDYKATTSGSLKTHMLSHENNRTYKCDFENCTYSCNTYNGLVCHKRNHSNEKPYKCIECDYKAKQSHHVKNHYKLYHTSDGQTRMKREEKRILKLLQDNNIPFKTNHPIDFTCVNDNSTNSRAYIDFVVEINRDSSVIGYVFLEIDEHQHKLNNYSVNCDNKRMFDVFQSLALEGNTFPVSFIRYNPNSFIINGAKVNPPVLKNTRETKLLETLSNWTFQQDNGIYYMYYDVDSEKNLEIFKDPEYDPICKELCIGCTV